MFNSIFDTTSSINIDIVSFLICMGVALILGIFMAKIYAFKTKCTKGFISTLALLPIVVSMVIIMVNGNIGTGVAVAGAFSLVRFRSVPGSAKEIGAIFTAMCTGLTLGMGYVSFAVIFSIIACLFSLVLNISNLFGKSIERRMLTITIPESLNYINVFEKTFVKYLSSYNLVSSKMTNMGSLFKLRYEIELKDLKDEKKFIDELRIKNGNLEIMVSKQDNIESGL